MKCENCGKRVSKRNDYCPKCGNRIEREIISNDYDCEKKHHQVFKVLSIIFITFLLIASLLLLLYIINVDSNDIVKYMTENDTLLALNIVTFFLPMLMAFIVSIVGWFAMVVINGIGIIISLLTMIKATKTKKIILLVQIILFIIFTIICFIIGPQYFE